MDERLGPPAGGAGGRASALQLRLPRLDEEGEVLRAHRATTPGVPNFLHGYEEGMPFAAYVQALADQARGVNMPAGFVPSTFLFAFDGARVVGRVSIRHALTDALLRLGGHIGYAVVPEFRRRGYATEMLRRAVRLAGEELGLDRVLLTCDDDNIGSIRVIERNGGVFENAVMEPGLEQPKRRYWIATRGGGA